MARSRQGFPSRGDHAKGLARPPASRGIFPPQASSVPAAERTWALRHRRVPDMPKRDDASAVVAISVYKAVNKAAPSKGGSRLATLVIRRPSDPADKGDVTTGHSKAPAMPAHRPGWTVAFSALVTPLLPWTVSMDITFIVHPASSFVAMWYPFPPRYLGDEDQDTYNRRRSPFGQIGRASCRERVYVLV